MSNEIEEKIIKFVLVSDSICQIEIKDINMSILNICAPTEERIDAEKEEFHENLTK